MRITNIAIHNFRSIDSEIIVPEKVNMFIGPCGTGKTSRLDAIRFALTGKVDNSDIRVGCKEMSVEITFEDGSSIKRDKNARGQSVYVNGKKTTAKSAVDYFEEKLGVPMSVYEALGDVDFFNEISKRDLTELLLGILPVKTNTEGVLRLAETKIGRDLTEPEKDQIRSLLPDGTFSLKAIEAAYRTAFNRRRELKPEVSMLAAKSDLSSIQIPAKSKEDLEKEYQNILTAELKAKDSLKQQKEYESCLKEYERSKQAKEQIAKDLEALKGIEAPDPAEKEKAEKEKRLFEENILKYTRAESETLANKNLKVKEIERLSSGNTCPLAAGVVCSTDLSAVRKADEEYVKKADEYIASYRDFIGRCKEQVKKREKILEEYRKKEVFWVKKQQLTQSYARIPELKMPERPEVINAVSVADDKARVQKEISVWSAIETAKNFQVLLKQKHEELALLEFAVGILDVKSGIRSLILERAMQTLESACNEKAEKFRNGYRIHFRESDGIEVTVTPRDGTGEVPLNRVSTGEFLFASYLLMTAINATLHAGYLMIDSLDKLDAESLKAFVKLLQEDPDIEHVFAATVNHADTEEVLNGLGLNARKVR